MSVQVLSDAFARARAEQRAALVGYLPAGYPSVADSVRAVQTLARAGADVIEVGLPYTDPMIDGPTIQHAATVALGRGTRTDDVFTVVSAAREAGAAVVVMSYWNPVLARGVDRFAADLAAAGGSGLITPDLIPEEAGAWRDAAERHDLAPVFLIAPSSTPERIASTAAACRGFVYVASVMGVTGARTEVGSGARDLVARAREATDLPLAVGLGVSTGAQAAEVARFADGVVVGSALVNALGDDADLTALESLTADLARGVRAQDESLVNGTVTR